MRNLLPDLGGELHRWSGQIQDTIDFAGFIGAQSRKQAHLRGHRRFRPGHDPGSVAGILISDLISKGYNPWTDVYDSCRKPLKAAATYLRENLTVATNFAEYVAPGEISSWDELEPGQGAIVRHGLRKVAAFRDANGESSPRPGASRSPIGRLSLSIQSS